MLQLSQYPKPVNLRDGNAAEIRLLTAGDEADLRRFFSELPPGERTYFRDDVTDPMVVGGWCREVDLNRVIPLVMVQGGRIVACFTLHRSEHSWTRHLAELRGAVHPARRRLGVSVAMVAELLSVAAQLELERVVLELVSPQKRLLAHFTNLGFSVEAVLKDWVKDATGRSHDLLVLSARIEPAWKRMEELLTDYRTHDGG